MNRSQIAAAAARTSLSGSDAASAVRAVLDTIAEALASGQTVAIAGFGTFATTERAPRKGRNPRNVARNISGDMLR